MKKLTCLFLLLFSINAFTQSYQDDSNFENEEDSFSYDPNYDGHLEYPAPPDIYDDTIANEASEESYIYEEE